MASAQTAEKKKLPLVESSPDFLWADKPAGLTTHTSLNDADKKKPWVDQRDGFMEWLEARVHHKLFPVHRLDRETTGAIFFALNPQAAERARSAFENREISKEYLFITDRKTPAADAFVAESFIERVGNEYVSKRDGMVNARTAFEKIRSQGRFTLWRAKPETGKPHQIRLHAEDSQIPLLGDIVHGGSDFPTLCLHSTALTLPSSLQTNWKDVRSTPPIYFEDLSLLSDRKLVRWLAAIDCRERALRSSRGTDQNQTLRWIHTEGNPLRLEQLGAVTHLNWFAEQLPNESDWRSIDHLLKIKGWSQWYLQLRSDRGKDPVTDHALASEFRPPERWSACENGLNFEFRRETGLSPGLFLDQRQNRAWLKTEVARSKQALVLNLFCYTGGFSVAAAAGGAKQVVSVDVSKPFLEWSKRNFEVNDLSTEPHEFRAIDAGEYLAWALKKDLKFDFIICDPPSFARTNTRGKTSVFRIETEFADLLKGCLKLTRAGSRILFSTNYEQWSIDQVAERAQAVIKAIKPSARLVSTPSPDLDFELPRAPRHMKSILIEV